MSDVIERSINAEDIARIKARRQQLNKAKRSPAKKPAAQAQKWVSISDLSTDAMKLASKVSGKVDCIIGVARSGLTPATIVATMLHLPLLVLRESEGDIIEAGHGWRLAAKEYNSPLVIDDTSCTGASLSRIRKVVEQAGVSPKYAVVYYDKQSKEPVDYFVKELPRPHVLEWNIANSVYASQMLWDMDGVICEDCPPELDDDGDKYAEWLESARPKCLPRRSKVRIVTGRREKWRPQTEAWLAKHGVAAELIMHPNGERTGKSIIQHKADAVLKYAAGPVAMLESDAQQARRIQEITGKAVWYVNDPPVQPVQEVKRMDWAAEYPCVHRGEVQAEGSCGCAGVDKIPVYACNETTGTQCVVLKSNQGRLTRKDGKWAGLRACEGCIFAKSEDCLNTFDSAAVLSVRPDNADTEPDPSKDQS